MGGEAGWLDQVGIKLSQLSTKLKLKLSSATFLKIRGVNFDVIFTFGSVSTNPLDCPRVGTEELILRD